MSDKVLRAAGKAYRETQVLKDKIALYESWMKRSRGRHAGTVWNDICREYPYLKED